MKVRDSYPYLTLNINSQPTQELQNRASSSKEVKNVGVPNSSGYPDKNFGVVTKKRGVSNREDYGDGLGKVLLKGKLSRRINDKLTWITYLNITKYTKYQADYKKIIFFLANHIFLLVKRK